jgi:hypothetical protein
MCPDSPFQGVGALVVAAIVRGEPADLDRARSQAVTTRDRQLVAIAQAHLDNDPDLVDALARDHLVHHPDNYLVAWIAAGAPGPSDTGERWGVR